MQNIFDNFTASSSALFASVLHARSRRMVQMRVLGVGTLLTGVFFLSMNGIAQASTNFDDLAGKTVENTNVAANIVTYISYIGGAILSALGIVDLKRHVENASQVKMKDGLAKLGFGGMLIALPFIVNATIGTFGGEDSSGAKYNEISNGNFNIGG